MTKPQSLSASLLERAAEVYDFSSGLRLSGDRVELPPAAAPAQPVAAPRPTAPAATVASEPQPRPPAARRKPVPEGRSGTVDRAALRNFGFILPDAPVSGLAEEFRIVKRQLLLGVNGAADLPENKRQSILVCSANPDEGKTFSAVNLALSLASEKDLDVLLVDGDFSKPEIIAMLGLDDGPGLIDAIADPAADPDAFVIQTDLGGLSVLPAGRRANNVTELLASARTRQVLDDLTLRHPNRVVIFDSPPALMASPASVLATCVGQVLMVVRADETSESDLREAIGLLTGCDSISLMLNGAGFAASSRRFGSYYGISQ